MDKLLEPLSKATQDSYYEGLYETGQIVKELREE
jgi:hypothetical protein